MSVKNVFVDDTPYEAVTATQWGNLIAATVSPPTVSYTNNFGMVSIMNGGTFSPSTTDIFGFDSANFYSLNSAFSSPANDQIQITAAGIYRLDFRMLYTAGVGISATITVETVSGSIVDLISTNDIITPNYDLTKIITFTFDATAGTIISLQGVVSAGSLGLSFDNLSSVVITRLY